MNSEDILFSVENKPGMLHEALDMFKKEKLNLTKIESRPSKIEPWKYYFFIDIEGHIENMKLKTVLAHLTKECNLLKHLGSYPKA